MIQPVSAFSPRAGFRGKDGTSNARASKTNSTNTKIAFINAGGVAAAAGGFTTAVARTYTSSWAHASVLGMCGAFLAMFFMTPHLIEKTGIGKTAGKQSETTLFAKTDGTKVASTVKEHLKPAKKLVQFRQQA